MRLNLSSPSLPQLYAMVALTVFAWSFGPICIRYAFEYDMPPDVIATLRMMIGAIAFTPIVFSRYTSEIRSLSLKHVLLAVLAGIFFSANIIAMITSLEHVTVMINQVLIGTNPIWVAILEVTVLKARLNRMVWAGILLAFGGGVIVAVATSGGTSISAGGDATFGVLLALFAAVAASLYFIIGRSVRSSVSLGPYIWIVYTSGTIFSLIILMFNKVPVVGYDPRGYFWVFMLALLAQIIGHGTLNYVVKFLPPTLLSVMGQSVPVLSAIWAMLIFTEIPTPIQMVGGIIIIVGVTVVLTGQNQIKKRG